MRFAGVRHGFRAPLVQLVVVLGPLACGNGPTPPLPGPGLATLSAGVGHACAVIAGSAECWGMNHNGELGTGDTTSRTVPSLVSGSIGLSVLSAGYGRTCGLATGGAAYCWGDNFDGELGNGRTCTINAPCNTNPVAVVGALAFATIGAGGDHTCGLTNEGVAYCWGSNVWGQLGSSNTTGPGDSAPRLVVGGQVFATITVGGSHTCGITRTRVAFCWGWNEYGQLGTGTNPTTGCGSHHMIPFSCSPLPVPVAGGLAFLTLSASGIGTCGLTVSGRPYCWGGHATNVPTAVPRAPVFVALSAADDHACGVTTDGGAYCWGANDSGQLGDASTTSDSVPVVVAGGMHFGSITVAYGYSCAETTGGLIYCWGDNSFGELGDSSVTSSAVPVKVAGQH